MQFSRKYFVGTAVCAFAAATLAITVMLLQLGIPRPAGVEETAALAGHPLHVASLWINLAVVFFMLPTLWGIAAFKLRTAAGAATAGFVFFLPDFCATFLYNSLQLFTANGIWLRLQSIADTAQRELLLERIGFLNDVYQALFFLILMGATVGALLFGIAWWRGRGIERWVSVGYFIAAAINLSRCVAYYASIPFPFELAAVAMSLLMPGILVLAAITMLAAPRPGIEAGRATA